VTRDDIIRMARDCWPSDRRMWSVDADLPRLERFAALVAAAERERLKWDGIHSCHSECDRPACVNLRKAVEAEREACAKVCEQKWGAAECADAIRARGEK
jgi:hypothetical protein